MAGPPPFLRPPLLEGRWSLIPLHHVLDGYRCSCARPDCPTPGKHPRIKDWPNRATSDEATIRAWWQRWPDANVGLATGQGLIDIETDAKHEGEDHLAQLERQLGPLPDTVAWISGGGGTHRLYRTDQAIRNAAGIGADLLGIAATGIDVRGEHGLAVLPPSNHVSGNPYRWTNCDPESIEVAALPGTWAEYLARRTEPALTECAEQPIPSGQRNTALTRIAGLMRRGGLSQAAICSALQETNNERCRPPLPAAEVALIARSVVRYEPDQATTAMVEAHWEQDHSVETSGAEDPGPIPDELLHIPGFVGEVMDHCLATAPYPNRAMAFCGALALQAFLAGRKVREPGGLRTNLYLLGLAHSSSGKDWPRKLNTRILHAVGLADHLGDKFASGEGLQDALLATPAMLFQTDEIDGMLQSINKAQDARHEGIMGALLTFFTSADSVVPMRRKAGTAQPGVIDQPCLVVFGTAIPNHYYAALSPRMLTNGFFARTIVVESGPRGRGQDPRALDPPEALIQVAQSWAERPTGPGDLHGTHPAPTTVAVSAEAHAILADCRRQADEAYATCEAEHDSVGTTVWGRVNEQARRLALLYAVSADHRDPCIDAAAATWATRFALHQTRRMLFMASGHVAESPFHADCLRLLEKLRGAPGGVLDHSVLLKRMKLRAREFTEAIETLVQQGDVEVVSATRAGAPRRQYRLRSRFTPTFHPGHVSPPKKGGS